MGGGLGGEVEEGFGGDGAEDRGAGGRVVCFGFEGEGLGSGGVLEVDLVGGEAGMEGLASGLAPGFKGGLEENVSHDG